MADTTITLPEQGSKASRDHEIVGGNQIDTIIGAGNNVLFMDPDGATERNVSQVLVNITGCTLHVRQAGKGSLESFNIILAIGIWHDLPIAYIYSDTTAAKGIHVRA